MQLPRELLEPELAAPSSPAALASGEREVTFEQKAEDLLNEAPNCPLWWWWGGWYRSFQPAPHVVLGQAAESPWLASRSALTAGVGGRAEDTREAL